MVNITQGEYESKYLENEHPILIKPLIAASLNSDRQAYFIQQVKYWMNKNRDKGRNYHDGQQWMFNTLDDWHAEFPWLSVMTIRRIVDALKNNGILLTGNYNKKKYDKTTWYSIDERKLDEVIERYKCECSKRTKASVQNEQMDDNKMNEPIPETYQILKESVQPAEETPAPAADTSNGKTEFNATMAYLNDVYNERFGYDYPIVKGQDHGIMKNLLKQYGLQMLREIIKMHINTKDDWIIKRGCSLTTMKKSVPEYLVTIKKAVEDEEADSRRREQQRQQQEQWAREEAAAEAQRAAWEAKPEREKIEFEIEKNNEMRTLWQKAADDGNQTAADRVKDCDAKESALLQRIEELRRLEAVAS